MQRKSFIYNAAPFHVYRARLLLAIHRARRFWSPGWNFRQVRLPQSALLSCFFFHSLCIALVATLFNKRIHRMCAGRIQKMRETQFGFGAHYHALSLSLSPSALSYIFSYSYILHTCCVCAVCCYDTSMRKQENVDIYEDVEIDARFQWYCRWWWDSMIRKYYTRILLAIAAIYNAVHRENVLC